MLVKYTHQIGIFCQAVSTFLSILVVILPSKYAKKYARIGANGL